jgi:hypothetical protein
VFAFTGRKKFISIENVWHPYKNSKTTREAYLGQDLSIHVNHSSIHLVIQSLKCVEDKGKIFLQISTIEKL